MKMNYSKQYLLASAIQIVTLVVLVSLLAFYPVYAEGENGMGGNPSLQNPAEVPTEAPTEAPDEQEQPTLPADSKLEKNPFTQGDFEKNGYFVSCKTEKTAVGIDVSEWQGNINWEKVKAAGVDYVMIRAGFRGTSSGIVKPDKRAGEYYAGAKAAGLKVGFYFYSQARTVAEAKEEAQFLMDTVKDYDVDLPLVCDWEYADRRTNPRLYGMKKQKVTDCIRAFCDTVRAEGYPIMFYVNNYVMKEKIYVEQLADYSLWYADYNRYYLNAPYRVDMWQYTDKGRVSGISGNVDMNVLFLENSIFAKIFAED